MTSDEIKLGYLLLEFLRVNARDRAVHKFNAIGRSTKGEFEFWLQREVSSADKQSLIWIWDELKRARLINATGEDLVNPDDWVLVSPKGLTITEREFAELFFDEPRDSRMSERLIDAVTGIFQRGELNNDLGKIENRESDDPPLGFIMIDIDHFEEFNNTHGHPIGDVVLRTVAQTIAAVVNGKGDAYRYGGEEFSVILRNHNLVEAQAVAQRIRTEIEIARIDSLPGIGVTASLGVGSIPETSGNGERLVADADRALYQAKNEGRNRVRCATKETSGTPVAQKIAATLEAAGVEQRIAVFREEEPLVPTYFNDTDPAAVPTYAYQTWGVRPRLSLQLKLDRALETTIKAALAAHFKGIVPGYPSPPIITADSHVVRWQARVTGGGKSAGLTYVRYLEITSEGAIRYWEKIDRHETRQESISDLYIGSLQFWELVANFYQSRGYSGSLSVLHRIDCSAPVQLFPSFPDASGMYHNTDAISFPDGQQYGIAKDSSRVVKELVSFEKQDREEIVLGFMLAHLRQLCEASIDYEQIKALIRALPDRAPIPPY
jgi:diguanylate cyclase (GGDEF)-like protein